MTGRAFAPRRFRHVTIFSDAIMGFLVLNEIRHRIVASVFGVAREDSNAMSVVAVGSLAEGLQGGAARVLAAGAIPPVAAAVIGAAAIRETVQTIAGPSSRTVPFFGGLLVVAVLGTSFGPLVRGSLHGARSAGHGMSAGSRRVRALVMGA